MSIDHPTANVGDAVKGPTGRHVGFISDVEETDDGIRYSMTITDEETKALLARPVEAKFSERATCGAYTVDRDVNTIVGMVMDVVGRLNLRNVVACKVLHAPQEPLVHRYLLTAATEVVTKVWGLEVGGDRSVRPGWLHVVDDRDGHHPVEINPTIWGLPVKVDETIPPGRWRVEYDGAAIADSLSLAERRQALRDAADRAAWARTGEGGVSITSASDFAATSGPEREKKPDKNGESSIGGPQKPAPDDRRIDDQRHLERDRKDTSDGR